MGYPTCPVFARALQVFQEEYPEITTCAHEATGISGAPYVTCRDHIKGFLGYRPPENMDRRDLKGLPVLLSSLVQDQLSFCHSRLWFSPVPKDLLRWGPTPFSGDVFHCFISWNEKIFFWKPDINSWLCCSSGPVFIALYPSFWTYSLEGSHLPIPSLHFLLKHPQVSLSFPFFWSFSLFWILSTLLTFPLMLCHSNFTNIQSSETSHLSLRFLPDLCVPVYSLPFCVGLYTNICYRSLCFPNTWHFFPLVFPFLRFKILFCLKVIWLADKYRHDSFNIKWIKSVAVAIKKSLAGEQEREGPTLGHGNAKEKRGKNKWNLEKKKLYFV